MIKIFTYFLLSLQTPPSHGSACITNTQVHLDPRLNPGFVSSENPRVSVWKRCPSRAGWSSSLQTPIHQTRHGTPLLQLASSVFWLSTVPTVEKPSQDIRTCNVTVSITGCCLSQLEMNVHVQLFYTHKLWESYILFHVFYVQMLWWIMRINEHSGISLGLFLSPHKHF